jgi:hypothetical protein
MPKTLQLRYMLPPVTSLSDSLRSYRLNIIPTTPPYEHFKHFCLNKHLDKHRIRRHCTCAKINVPKKFHPSRLARLSGGNQDDLAVHVQCLLTVPGTFR